MPVAFDLRTRLELAKTDPNLISWVFNNGPAPEDVVLYQQYGGDFFRYEEMLIDPQIGGKLDERVGALLGRAVLVDAASEDVVDTEAANIVKRILDLPVDLGKSKKKEKKRPKPLLPYEQICGNFLNSALLCGFSVQAVVDWEDRGGVMVPELEFVPQRRFTFAYRNPDDKTIPIAGDEEGLDPAKDIVLVNGYELRLLTRRSPVQGERCSRNRFICYSYGSMKGLPQGLGLGYRIRKFYEIRKEVMKSGVLTAQALGSPPVHGEYPPDLSPNNLEHKPILDAFERLLKAISPNAYASTTTGFKISFLETNTAGHEILKWLYDTAALEITRAIWGEGSYSEKVTGSYSAEKQQAENRNENFVDADCNSLDEGPCARLWQLIGEMNFPNASPPVVRRETESERRRLEQEQKEEETRETKRSGRIQSDRTLIMDFGLEVSDDYIKETYGEAFSFPKASRQTESRRSNINQEVNSEIPEELPGSVNFGVIIQEVNSEIPEELPGSVNFGVIIDRVLDWQGLKIGVEYLPGQVRFPGRQSSKKLRSGYGHIRNYLGADKEALDCYIYPGLLPSKEGEEPQGSSRIFQVDQVSPEDGDFDEHKFMIGYESLQDAQAAYLTEMPAEYFGRIKEITVSDLEQYKR